MVFSLFCVLAASGELWTPRAFASTPRLTGTFSTGSGRDSFAQLWLCGLLCCEQLHKIDWSWLAMDGALTKSPLGGEKNRPKSNRSGQARRQAGGRDRSHGIPLGVSVAGANCNDFKLTRETPENILPKRPKPTRSHPQGLCLDKGFACQEVYEVVKEFGFTLHIPSEKKEAQNAKRNARTRAPMGGGKNPQLAESLLRHTGPLVIEGRELRRHASLGLCGDYLESDLPKRDRL
jgi:hypothetical protein